MKNIYKYFLLISVLSTTLAKGQEKVDLSESVVDTVQVNNALKFIKYFAKNDSESAWLLFDTVRFPQLTKENFSKGMSQVYGDLSLFDDYELTYNGIKIVENERLKFYTFKAISSKKVIYEFNINIYFYESSKLIAGIQPEKKEKGISASTSKAKETELEKSFTAKIEGKEYQIKGINIVHFENNGALLAIQVEYPYQENEEVYKLEAIKFARYIIKKGYVKKAESKSKEEKLTLLEDIGVSFFDPKKDIGFNVMVKPSEYK